MKGIRVINKVSGIVILAIAIAVLAFMIVTSVSDFKSSLTESPDYENQLRHYYTAFLLEDSVACYNSYVREQDSMLDECHIKMGKVYWSYTDMQLLEEIRETLHTMYCRDISFIEAIDDNRYELDAGFCNKAKRQARIYLKDEGQLILKIEELSKK
jgi:hypothetical protein